jgi:hypothetical protein
MTSLPYAQSLTDDTLAELLDFIAPQLGSVSTREILQEAASRLRGEPAPHFVTSPGPDLPPLKACADPPDPDATPIGLIVDRITRAAFEKSLAES